MPCFLDFALVLSTILASSDVAAFSLRHDGRVTTTRRLDDTDFTPIGANIYDALPNFGDTEFGISVDLASSLPTRPRLAIGATFRANDNANGGAVYVYENDGNDTWNVICSLPEDSFDQIKGDRLSIDESGLRIAVRNTTSSALVYQVSPLALVGAPIPTPESGNTITLSPDGNRVAISSENYLSRTGRVDVYESMGIGWQTLGGSIPGPDTESRFGWITAFSSDGNRLAVSAPNFGGNNGLVQVYDYDAGGGWTQVGQNITGASAGISLGFSMDLSGDGTTLIIGAPTDVKSGSPRDSGTVTAYKYTGSSWDKQGEQIPGIATNDRFGRSVSVSHDGLRVAASSYTHDRAMGQVRVFEYEGNSWVQVGSDIDGDARKDRLGFGILGVSLSGDGLQLAAGSVPNRPNDATGPVRVFDAPPRPTTMPSVAPSTSPTKSAMPSIAPSITPSTTPSTVPSLTPTNVPSETPSSSSFPSMDPTGSISPTMDTNISTGAPSERPSFSPSGSPSAFPSVSPTATTTNPSEAPSASDPTPNGIPSPANRPIENTSSASIGVLSFLAMTLSVLVGGSLL